MANFIEPIKLGAASWTVGEAPGEAAVGAKPFGESLPPLDEPPKGFEPPLNWPLRMNTV